MNAIARLAASVADALKGLLVLLLALLVLVVSWQVLARYVLAEPDQYSEEIARVLLMWFSLLGAAYAARTGAHLGLDLLASRLAGKARQIADWMARGAMMLFAVIVLIFGGARLVYLTAELEQRLPALNLPVAVVYAVLPLAGALMVLFALAGRQSGKAEQSA